MNYPTYHTIAANIIEAYNRSILHAAKHNVEHGCYGTCEKSRENKQIIGYLAEQMWQLKLSYEMGALIERQNHASRTKQN